MYYCCMERSEGKQESGAFCTSCGAEFQATANFCAKCGKPLEEKPKAPQRRPLIDLSGIGVLVKFAILAGVLIVGIEMCSSAAKRGNQRALVEDYPMRVKSILAPCVTAIEDGHPPSRVLPRLNGAQRRLVELWEMRDRAVEWPSPHVRLQIHKGHELSLKAVEALRTVMRATDDADRVSAFVTAAGKMNGAILALQRGVRQYQEEK